MIKLFTLFLEICAFKKGPQDVPAAKALLQLLAILYMAISFLVLILNMDAATALMQSIVETLLVLGFPWLLLNLARKPARYLQTVTALLGCDILISLCALPALSSLSVEPTPLGLAAVFMLMIWNWLVTGYIFKHALSQPFLFGIGVALLYFLLSYQVIGALFPTPVSSGG
jgi:hypothetical protein